MYVCGQTSQAILQYSLSTAWDVSTASYDNVSRDVFIDTLPQDITFKPDGIAGCIFVEILLMMFIRWI